MVVTARGVPGGILPGQESTVMLQAIHADLLHSIPLLAPLLALTEPVDSAIKKGRGHFPGKRSCARTQVTTEF